ncbi:hypothetical protein EVB87_187 [Rhizobium phage RHph_N28_1]|nr:hypothetical protein EVB87_187 [Rhizobium phage RHph_N28_1]QIG74216.1 hypothetical protein EVC07_188 [Rhizobium phage RHph_N42]QIG74823.1 hypothetical protein EVC12_188 [Rhizobium phage RHph_I42]QXV73875.1 hypothetical protein [Rhizobium phage RHph_N46]
MTIVTLNKPDGTTEDVDLTFPFYMRLKEPMLFAGILTFDIRVEEHRATNVMTYDLNGNQVQVNSMLQDAGTYLGMYYYDPNYEAAPDSSLYDAAYAAALERFAMTP